MREIQTDISAQWKNAIVKSVHIKGDLTKAGSYRLHCVFLEKPYYGEGSDYFEALQILRKRFEKNQIKLLCEGAKKEVWPSSMSREMGGGIKAYKCYMGQPAKEMVNIFDADETMEYASVEEQSQYHKEWFKSLQ